MNRYSVDRTFEYLRLASRITNKLANTFAIFLNSSVQQREPQPPGRLQRRNEHGLRNIEERDNSL